MPLPEGYNIDRVFRIAGFPYGRPTNPPPGTFVQTASNSWDILVNIFDDDVIDYNVDYLLSQYIDVPKDVSAHPVFDHLLAAAMLDLATAAGITPVGRPFDAQSIAIGDISEQYVTSREARASQTAEVNKLRQLAYSFQSPSERINESARGIPGPPGPPGPGGAAYLYYQHTGGNNGTDTPNQVVNAGESFIRTILERKEYPAGIMLNLPFITNYEGQITIDVSDTDNYTFRLNLIHEIDDISFTISRDIVFRIQKSGDYTISLNDYDSIGEVKLGNFPDDDNPIVNVTTDMLTKPVYITAELEVIRRNNLGFTVESFTASNTAATFSQLGQGKIFSKGDTGDTFPVVRQVWFTSTDVTYGTVASPTADHDIMPGDVFEVVIGNDSNVIFIPQDSEPSIVKRSVVVSSNVSLVLDIDMTVGGTGVSLELVNNGLPFTGDAPSISVTGWVLHGIALNPSTMLPEPSLANAGKFTAIKSDGSGWEIVDKPSGGTPTPSNQQLPAASSANAGKFTAIKSDGSGWEVVDKPTANIPDNQQLPAASSSDAGKFTAIKSDGSGWEIVDKPSGGSGGFPTTRTEILSASGTSTKTSVTFSEAIIANQLYELVRFDGKLLFMTNAIGNSDIIMSYRDLIIDLEMDIGSTSGNLVITNLDSNRTIGIVLNKLT